MKSGVLIPVFMAALGLAGSVLDEVDLSAVEPATNGVVLVAERPVQPSVAVHPLGRAAPYAYAAGPEKLVPLPSVGPVDAGKCFDMLLGWDGESGVEEFSSLLLISGDSMVKVLEMLRRCLAAEADAASFGVADSVDMSTKASDLKILATAEAMDTFGALMRCYRNFRRRSYSAEDKARIRRKINDLLERERRLRGRN